MQKAAINNYPSGERPKFAIAGAREEIDRFFSGLPYFQPWVWKMFAAVGAAGFAIGDSYDYAVIDNAPDENMSVINALVAGDDVIIPVKIDQFTFDGVDEMLSCIQQVKENYNPDLSFRGCVITSFKNNEVNRQGKSFMGSLSKYKLMDTHISWTPKIDESTFAALPIMKHSPRSWAARDYKKLAREYLSIIGELSDSDTGSEKNEGRRQ